MQRFCKKQQEAISLITHSGFKSILKKYLRDTAHLLSVYHNDLSGMPPAVREKLTQISQMLHDWMQCVPSSGQSQVIDLYMNGIAEICHHPELKQRCPRLLKEVARAAPLILQNQVQDLPHNHRTRPSGTKHLRQDKGSIL